MNNYLDIDEQAVLSAKKFLRSEAELLENIQRVDEARVWARLSYTSLFKFCRDLKNRDRIYPERSEGSRHVGI